MDNAVVPSRWKHKKRGTKYTLLTEAKMQCSTHKELDYAEVVMYQGDDGHLWVRLKDEFFDGRFEEILPTYTEGHCENLKAPGGCQLHNLQCGYPDCDWRKNDE